MADQGSEFDNTSPHIGPQKENGFVRQMRENLPLTFAPGEVAEKLGFGGFRDRIVADVGCRDGRFVPVFSRLGAREVYGIDPNSQELEQAVTSGFLDREHIVPTRLEDLPPPLRGHFDVAVVLNYNISLVDADHFARALGDCLMPQGQVVATVAEEYWQVRGHLSSGLQKAGFEVKIGLNDTFLRALHYHPTLKDDFPHKYLIVARK